MLRRQNWQGAAFPRWHCRADRTGRRRDEARQSLSTHHRGVPSQERASDGESTGLEAISCLPRLMLSIAREAHSMRGWKTPEPTRHARRPPLLWSDCTSSLRPNQWHVPASSGEWDVRHSRWRQGQHRRVGCPPPPMVLHRRWFRRPRGTQSVGVPRSRFRSAASVGSAPQPRG